MTRNNVIIMTGLILLIVVVWYFTQKGILGRKQENLEYSFGTLNFGNDSSYTTGCTDPNALNYNPNASSDNGLCFFQHGCCDVNATNYDALADSCNVPDNNLIMCNYS